MTPSQYTYQPPQKKKSRTWVVVLLVAAVLVIGCGIAGIALVATGVDSAQKAVDDAVSSAAANGGIPGAPVATTPPAAPVAGQVGEGRHEVGKDVQAGTYKATVPTESIGCYWARLKDLDGETTSILANGIGQPGSKLTVTIKTTDKGFETQGCGTWVKA